MSRNVLVRYVSHGRFRECIRTERRLNDRAMEGGNDTGLDPTTSVRDVPLGAALAPRPGALASSPDGESARPRRQLRRRAFHEAIDEPDGELVRRYQAVLQQTIAAHRVIGRLNFERDALARQLETLQASSPNGVSAPTSLVALAQATPPAASGQRDPSVLQALDRFFNSGDIWGVRRRRMGFVLGLLAVAAVTWGITQTGLVVLPAKLSRDSLGDLPFVGTTLRLVMGVWSMFRVVRISARGVRWAFPEEGARRRRR